MTFEEYIMIMLIGCVAISNVLNFLVMKDACNNLAVISIWVKNIAQGNK